MWIVASIGRRRVCGPAATLRPTARRIETAALGIRCRHMRTRALMERAVWTVWTGAAQDRQAQAAAGGPHAKPHAQAAPRWFVTLSWAHTARSARGADSPRRRACGGAGSPGERAAGGGA